MAKTKTYAVGIKFTKEPTGLSISRDNNTFNFAWKITDTYDGGQWIAWIREPCRRRR